MQYSGTDKKRGIVFEIQVGRIDIGADISQFSQYPKEQEFWFPPLCCLEVVGEPRWKDCIVFFPLRINTNLKMSTLKQVQVTVTGSRCFCPFLDLSILIIHKACCL